MDTTPATNGAASIRLRRSWQNTDGTDAPYWPTVADFLNDLQSKAAEYQRKARRRQRLSFEEVLQIRRLLYCLGEVQAHRNELSTADRTAFDEAGERLRQAFAELAKAERLSSELLLAQVRQRLSPEWTRWLSANISSMQQHLYVIIQQDAEYFTLKARSKERLTPQEAEKLSLAANRIVYFNLAPPSDKRDDRSLLHESCEYAHKRIMRIVKLMSLRFGVTPARDPDLFWHNFRRRVTGSEDTLEQAILNLLRTVPDAWGRYEPDGMTDPQARALFLLVAAGMVERRSTFRLRLFGHPSSVKATITVTGECGAVEALEQLATGMWAKSKTEKSLTARHSRPRCSFRSRR